MYGKRGQSQANISPLSNSINDKRQKLIDQITACDFNNTAALDSDSSVPDYAKTIIRQLGGLLQTAVQLLNEQPSTKDFYEEERRQHTVVITNLSESTDNTPTKRAQSDINSVHQMLDTIGLDSELPTNVFRMGRKRDDGNRLLKIEFPTKFATRYFLKNRHKIKSISSFKNVNIRESLSRSQLDARHKLISSCNEQRKATGKDFVVYAGMVVLRDTIPAIRQQNV